MFNNFNSCTLYFTLYIKKCLIILILERLPTGENSFCSKEKHKIICQEHLVRNCNLISSFCNKCQKSFEVSLIFIRVLCMHDDHFLFLTDHILECSHSHIFVF